MARTMMTTKPAAARRVLRKAQEKKKAAAEGEVKGEGEGGSSTTTAGEPARSCLSSFAQSIKRADLEFCSSDRAQVHLLRC